jgi:hypothetical protein
LRVFSPVNLFLYSSIIHSFIQKYFKGKGLSESDVHINLEKFSSENIQYSIFNGVIIIIHRAFNHENGGKAIDLGSTKAKRSQVAQLSH